MRRFFVLLAVLSLVAVAGCSGEKTAEDTAENVAADIKAETQDDTDAAQAAMSADNADHFKEVACGSCVYKMEGVQGCVAAVKIDDKPVLLTGVPVDAHALGLCKAPQKAYIDGAMKDETFEATKVTFE